LTAKYKIGKALKPPEEAKKKAMLNMTGSFHGSTASSFNQTLPAPKSLVGLNACQRQGPSLQVKKAFNHKKRKFERDSSDPRLECEHCGRAFLDEVFAKH